MKRILLFLVLLILFMAISSNGEITYYTQSRLFVGEIEQEFHHEKIEVVRPFIVLPNISLRSSDSQQDFLRSIFNFKEIILKEEAQELKWEPLYHKKKAIFPRIVQTVKVEGNKFEMTLIPVGQGVSIGFRIQISLVKSLPEEKRDVLSQLQAVYNSTSKGRILMTEIMDFGNLFFICFPMSKRIYIISFYNISMIGAIIY